MKPKMKQYGYWETDTNDPDSGYWMQYDTLEDAVSEKGDGAWIYELKARYLGRFKRKVSLIKQRERGNETMATKTKKKKLKSIAQGTKPAKKLTIKKSVKANGK